MTDLHKQLYVERFRPQDWDSLILENKSSIINQLKNPASIPSFIFYSNKPGTGKTTTTKLIIKTLGCDAIVINASDDRGIDVIRERINGFARAMSSNPNCKRCVFMDEFDSCTKVAQEALKSTMEEYSSSCFFIFTANDFSKIIEPIQSRCVAINFEKPSKADIYMKLESICTEENIKATDEEITALMNQYYPDIRSMVKTLQNAKIENKPITIDKEQYEEFLKAIRSNNVDFMFHTTYSSDFDLYAFNRWLFSYFFNNASAYPNTICDIGLALAEVEKGFSIGVNAPVIFLANMVKIAKLLK